MIIVQQRVPQRPKTNILPFVFNGGLGIGQAATNTARSLPFLLMSPHARSSPGLPWIQRPVGRGSCPNSPHPSDRTQLSKGGEGTLDKTAKQRLGFVYLICLTQFPGPAGTGSELGDGVREGAWFPSLSLRLLQAFLGQWPFPGGHLSWSPDSAGQQT